MFFFEFNVSVETILAACENIDTFYLWRHKRTINFQTAGVKIWKKFSIKSLLKIQADFQSITFLICYHTKQEKRLVPKEN